jgi:hypothetical protein
MAWIHNFVPALGGARLVDSMVTARGRPIVEALLLQIQSGAYS